MARAESVTQGREMFEVYYSTTGTEIKDFISLDNESHRTTPEGWSECKFKVPAGAVYFAVRCTSHMPAPTPVDGNFIGCGPHPAILTQLLCCRHRG